MSSDAAFGHCLLAPRLREFMEKHPDLHVDLVVRDRVGDLIADGFDIAVRFGQLEDRHVESGLLLESRVLTCASKAFVARHGMPSRPQQLLDPHLETIRLVDDITGKPHLWHLKNGQEACAIDPGAVSCSTTREAC